MDRRNVLRASTAISTATAIGWSAKPATANAASDPGGATDRPLRVHIVLFDGVEELDFAAPYEVFSAAGLFTEREVDVRYVSLSGPGTVQAAYGTRLRVEHGWSPRTADVLVVPGGGYARPEDPGVRAEIRRGVLPRALAEAVRPGLTISALCSGVMLLSAAGLTANRSCTTHHRVKADLEKAGGLVKNARVVDDGDLVTAAGITSGLELGLWLVRRELGANTAITIEAMLEYEARGTVWTPPAGHHARSAA